MNELNRAIYNTKKYDEEKLKRIQNIKNAFENAASLPLSLQFELNEQLYNEYKIFRFDSAYFYAKKVQQTASELKDSSKIAQSKINLLFVFTSAGMYKEATEVVNEINVTGQPDSLKAAYYALRARYYFDLADYVANQVHTPEYNRMGGASLDSALLFFPAHSFESIYYNGLRNLKNDNLEKAAANFKILLSRTDLTDHQTALVNSTLSHIYLRRGDKAAAINYQIRAAIADIKSSTKETFAIYNLSQLLFEEGDFTNASLYIEKAIDEATFYGARQRKVQVSTILPIIQSSRINYIEGQRRMWIIYGAVVSIILFVLTALILIINRQKKKLEQAKKVIFEAHQELSAANGKLIEANARLQNVNAQLEEVNSKLQEANKIKEEYIGYFFNINSVFFHKIERLKYSIEQKLGTRKLEEIRFIIDKIDVKGEKDELMKSFDKAFLKLFPHFVTEFNALLREEERISLQDDELLNTDLRIYALIRLGVKENEKIADILEYSVKSIYAYKTRIRNKAIVPKEEFDKKVMEIKSV